VPDDGVLRVTLELDHTPPPHVDDKRGLCLGLTTVTLQPAPPASPVAAPEPAAGAAVGGGFWVDLSSLCVDGGESWSARRWRLGLAQALCRVAGVGWAAARGQALVEVPRPLALGLLGAAQGPRAVMLRAALGELADLPLRPGDRVLTLGLAADNTASRMARRAGGLVTLALASTAALARPHRAGADAGRAVHEALFTPHSPFDAVLLAADDPALAGLLAAQARRLPWAVLPAPGTAILPLPPAGEAQAGPEDCVLTESFEPVVAESWALLPAPPPLHLLAADDAVAIEVLLARCRLVLAANLAGAWPGLALAAAGEGLPCLAGGASPVHAGEPAFDPADARANAAALLRLLGGGGAPVPVDPGPGWDALAAAALRFDPMRPAAAPPPPAPRPGLPALTEAWALAATARR